MKKTTVAVAPAYRFVQTVLAVVLACALCVPTVAVADTGATLDDRTADSGVLTLGDGEDDADGIEDASDANTGAVVLSTKATASYRYARVMKDGYLYTTDSTGTVKGSYVWGDTRSDCLANLEKVDVLFVDANVTTLKDVKIEIPSDYPYKDGKVGFGRGVFWTGRLVAADGGLVNMSKIVFKTNSAGHSSLKSLENSVAYGNYATFMNCTRLKTLENFDKTSVEEIPSSCFNRCSMLTSVKLPDTCIKVGSYAFYKCSALASVDFGKVEQIEKEAFVDCVELKNVDLPSTCDFIGQGVFNGCTALNKVIMRNTSKAALDGVGFKGTPVGTEDKSNYFYVPNSVLSKYTLDNRNANDWYSYRTKFKPFLEVGSIANQTYTGKAIKPAVSVTWIGSKLDAKNYTVSYKNNVNVGTATATVTGKGSYAGTASRTFKIVKGAAKWTRLWGNTQFDTMAKVVQAGWKKNAGGTVILATAANFPDALSASGVAGLYGAPVLLTNKASLPAQTKSELARIKPSRVIIAGGPGAIKAGVDAQVKAACGVRPTRCYGSTASDTAAKLATTYVKKRSDTAILATSKFFYDSLSAAPVAYAKHYPILLADSKDAVSKNTLNAMKSCGIKKVIIVGGTSVIGPKIVSQLKANGITVAERLGGRTYYDTSRLIALWGIANGMSANKMGVATSYKFYDALTGAALCGKNNAVLVLADDKGRANTSVVKANKSKISQGYVFGGVSAVGKTTYDAIVAASSRDNS